MKRKHVTKREEAKARAIVQAAMNQQRAAEVAEKRRLIGQCFKYPNRYSDGERWWLYAVVIAVDEHGRIATAQFQQDGMGTFQLQPDTYGGLLPQGGWQLIERREFEQAAAAFSLSFLRALGEATKVGAVDPVGEKVTG